ncbi:MAG: methanogenesis marker 15 protein [Halobacteriota archaeon]|nr:methanogenesis marker 15 protein [Halobacteriota archaeon]
MVKIAQISCGTEFAGIQPEINKAAESVGAEIVFPDIEFEYIARSSHEIGYFPGSDSLQAMLSGAKSIVDGRSDADGVFIATCFRCAEGALIRNEVRRYIQKNADLPVITYAFTERTKAPELVARMDALTTTISMKSLLLRKKQEGLTLGIDSGSSTTNAIVMEDNEIIGRGWVPTTDVVESADKSVTEALEDAGMSIDDIQTIGVTGYGRFSVSEKFKADLVIEEVSSASKGAVFLADKQEGEAAVFDIGGMNNKAITVRDGISDSFSLGGACAGSSGRFLEIVSRRLGMEIDEMGRIALNGDYRNVKMESYCMVFGIQHLVTTLAEGATRDDVAAAGCHSVAEQLYEQQLQEIEIRHPVIFVGGTSLLDGVVNALEEMIGSNITVPKDSQHMGAVGVALLASSYIH